MTDQYYNDSVIEIDQSTIKDFFDEFNDMYDLTVNAAEELEIPEKYSPALINTIFRGVHTIKSNLRMVGLKNLSDVVHHVENLLDQVRQNKSQYMPEFGDIIRLVLDETRVSAEKYFNKEPITEEFEYIANAIEHICKNPQSRREAIDIALKLLDPFNKGKPFKQKIVPPNQTINITETNIDNNAYQYVIDDLNFFKQISDITEKRILAPQGKIELISKIALKMNEMAKFKVEQIQLQAAVYLYNLGLSSLPVSIFAKQEMLNDEEIELIKKCSQTSADFLKNLAFWQPAATIVEQCHERADGSGYPNKLTKNSICDGAKILAIAYSFAAIFYAKPYQKINTRSIMAAILAMNNEAGSQFDETWVDLFNKSIKSLHQEQQLLKQ